MDRHLDAARTIRALPVQAQQSATPSNLIHPCVKNRHASHHIKPARDKITCSIT